MSGQCVKGRLRVLKLRRISRFVGVLDQLDTRVERIRKEAMLLQEKRDHLLISLDLIKNNDLFANLEERE